ncbi:Imm3 family immunity protein [Rheinheimera baltica]|uniref:Imm3 family immunity protein n=1 Tax=Rheinheimera baltica TaxID=67576 RepID=UPI00273ECDFB|nr:Imm3 family immunity protein [Rheinheimera baltica]MDP5190314.1 Imm3 family immunity protein [Rheinheimera baltica]
MDKWSYEELQEFIYEDILEFMGDGLDIRQATSRVQVEYAKAIEGSKLEKLIIFMTLCEEGVKHGFLRDDIKEQTLELLQPINIVAYEKQLNNKEIVKLRDDINRTTTLLG